MNQFDEIVTTPIISGQVAYAAWCKIWRPVLSAYGRPLPEWDELPETWKQAFTNWASWASQLAHKRIETAVNLVLTAGLEEQGLFV